MKNIELKVKGQIDLSWSDWFDGFEITHTGDGGSTLKGSLRDQPELRGMLNRLADLNLELVSVNISNSRNNGHQSIPEERTRRSIMNRAIFAILISGVLAVSLVTASCRSPAPAPDAMHTGPVPDVTLTNGMVDSGTPDEAALGAMQYSVQLLINQHVATGQPVPQSLSDAARKIEGVRLALLDLNGTNEATFSQIRHCLMTNEPVPGYLYDVLQSIARQRQQIFQEAGLVF